MRPRILVLEDDASRVRWLRRRFPGVEMLPASTVTELFEVLRGESRAPDLVVLDHDLGGGPRGPGVDGRSGMDAASRLPHLDGAPVLVWSVNPIKAPLMVESLQARRFYARHYAFGTPLCERFIAAALEFAAGEDAGAERVVGFDPPRTITSAEEWRELMGTPPPSNLERAVQRAAELGDAGDKRNLRAAVAALGEEDD